MLELALGDEAHHPPGIKMRKGLAIPPSLPQWKYVSTIQMRPWCLLEVLSGFHRLFLLLPALVGPGAKDSVRNHSTLHSRMPPDHSGCSSTSSRSALVSTGSKGNRLKRSISTPQAAAPMTGFQASPDW